MMMMSKVCLSDSISLRMLWLPSSSDGLAGIEPLGSR